MTDEEVKAIVTDIGTVHYYNNSSTEQLREIRKRLAPYRAEDARYAVSDYARRHEFLNVEALMQAVSEVARNRDMTSFAERAKQAEAERKKLATYWRERDEAVASLSDEEFATMADEALAETNYRPSLIESMRKKGRDSRPLRGLVYDRMRKAVPA